MVMSTTVGPDLQARKALGRSYLNENRIEDALRTYADILRENPRDVDAYLFLGDCYLAEGDGETALLLYRQAQVLAPGNVEVQRRVRLARLESQHLGGEDGSLPTDPDAIAALLQRLTGRAAPISETEVNKAARLLDEIIHHPHPAQAVAERLEDVDALLPALLELNIRQARADGRPDLVQALQSLLDNIYLQIDARRADMDKGRSGIAVQPALLPRRVLFIGSQGEDTLLRQTLPAEALSTLGCEVTVATQFPPDFQARFDLVVALHPHGDLKLMQGLAACSAAGLPVILELDADFEQMPVNHPDHDSLGLGTPASAKAYTSALLLADRVVVPSQNLANRLRANGYAAEVMLDGWNGGNALWHKPMPRRATLNLGWIGPSGQVEDVEPIRRVIARLMHEFSHVRLVIVGDTDVYQLFDNLPESRRLFLPPVSVEDYPYLLGQVDVLLVPLRNSPFNQSQSDRRLVEAGIRRIPWVASPIPSFVDWEVGGLIAHSLEEWHSHLRQLILDVDLRASLGRAGRRKAEEREMSQLGKKWFILTNQVIGTKVKE
jgi:hypothetical protein